MMFFRGTMVLVFLFALQMSNSKTLSQIKDSMEAVIGRLIDRILLQYAHKCESRVINCEVLSYNMCNGTGQRQCFSNFPTPQGCMWDGIYLSNNSTVKFPDSIADTQLSEKQRLFICTTAFAMEAFEEEGKKNNNQFTYAYVGSSTGIFRLYPGYLGPTDPITGQCFKFEPRRRPWYVSAITGPKNTVLLLDTSKTMKTFFNGVRLRNAMTTIQIIFETFNVFDRFAVVSFSDTAKILGGMDHIDHYSESYKEKILNDFQKIESLPGTNYRNAFEAAFQALGTQADQYAECPEIIMLILTDGTLESNDTYDGLVQLIEGKMAANLPLHTLRIISFVFGKAENINYEIVKKITCRYNGIVFLMEDNLDETGMVEKLSNYYIFLSDGLASNNPVWSEPYEDTAGFGTVISISKAIKYEDSNGIQKVLGVVGMDLLMSELTKYATENEDVAQILQEEIKCFANNLTPQQLEVLRCEEDSVCLQTTNCSEVAGPETLCNDTVVRKIFFSAQEAPYDDSYDALNCCGLSRVEFIAVLCSVLGFALILGIILGCLYRRGKLDVCCMKCRRGTCCLHFNRLSSSQGDGSDEIPRRDSGEQFQSRQKHKMLQGTKLQDPEGRYEKALKDGKIIYDDDDDLQF